MGAQDINAWSQTLPMRSGEWATVLSKFLLGSAHLQSYREALQHFIHAEADTVDVPTIFLPARRRPASYTARLA